MEALILLWICIKLAAPWWCYVILALDFLFGVGEACSTSTKRG